MKVKLILSTFEERIVPDATIPGDPTTFVPPNIYSTNPLDVYVDTHSLNPIPGMSINQLLAELDSLYCEIALLKSNHEAIRTQLQNSLDQLVLSQLNNEGADEYRIKFNAVVALGISVKDSANAINAKIDKVELILNFLEIIKNLNVLTAEQHISYAVYKSTLPSRVNNPVLPESVQTEVDRIFNNRVYV